MTETTRTTRRAAALLLVAGAVLANVAFAALGSAFDYPQVLQRPAGEVLAAFDADQTRIVLLFSILALGAGLLAPAAVLVARLIPGSLGRWSARVGVAAAAVQVIGLLRWPLIVPALATDDTKAFDTIHTVLGTVVGETFGYVLTALWTVLVVHALRRGGGPRWVSHLGIVASVLIVLGVAVPLGLPGADLANFAGYVLWTVWLVALAALVWRGRVARPERVATAAA
jgi:uncharacterized protein DUF4386